MNWVHIKTNRATMLEEQWILRHACAPVCSLKRDTETPTRSNWIASLLNAGGIAATVMRVEGGTLDMTKRVCEDELRRMGWELPEQEGEVA